MQEFKDFLQEYKVMGLAVAFIMAVATTALVQSLVNNIIMPVIGVVLPAGGWEEATLALGPVVFGVGPFLAALVNFLILALVVFLIAKAVLKEDKVAKK